MPGYSVLKEASREPVTSQPQRPRDGYLKNDFDEQHHADGAEGEHSRSACCTRGIRVRISDPGFVTAGCRSVLERTIRCWALAGGGVLSLVVAINVWTVIAGQVGSGFAGDFELTEIGVAIAAFTFLPYCQLTGQNVTADIFTMRVGRRTLSWLSVLAAIVALGFAALLLWRMSLGLLDQRGFTQTTAILQVPVWWAFVPILMSLALLIAAAALSLVDALKQTACRDG